MSGIAGFIELDGAPAEHARMDAMLASLHRRGPDRQRARVSGNTAFGQALLATTPEAMADIQPWMHPESGCVVVADSRLDNRPALLRTLGIDRDPDTVGDGELLHAAWQRWGHDCADHLRGDFAFAIWDTRHQRLFCARDPMGVRPLYLHHAPGKRLVFGSSADAVLAHGGIPRTLDEGRIADFLIRETEGIDAICTFFTQVQRMPPAHTLQWQDGQLTQHKYWHPLKDQPTSLPRNEAEWIEAQREQLERAVRLRLRSQYPVGSMLSGGLDSSSVVALASRLQEQAGAAPFPAFSAINSEDPGCEETKAIRAVLAATRSEGHLVDIKDLDSLAPVLLDWWQNLPEPFDGTMTLGGAVYHAAAKAGVRSLMDGVPSDNFFTTSGYERPLLRQGRLLQAWKVKRDYIATYNGSAWPGLRALSRLPGGFLPKPLDDFRKARIRQREITQLIQTSGIDSGFARRVDLAGRYQRYQQNMAEHARITSDAKAQSSLGVAYITAGLERYNRVGSYFGVEPRPPFTDRELIAFQARVPWALRLHEARPKWILRKAMHGLLPSEVAWRRGKEHLGGEFSTRLLQQLPPTASNQPTTAPTATQPGAPLFPPVHPDTIRADALAASLLHLWMRQQSALQKIAGITRQ